MIPKYLSATWAALAPALGNHLWQSTLFVAIAALLTLTLRKSHARTRYWLWLTASVKFLIPFALLVGMGSNLGWLRVWVGTKASLYSTMEEVSHPFTPPTISVISGGTPFAASDNWTRLLPVLLIALWLCGFVVVLLVWGMRWRRIFAAMRQALPLREGREIEALRRLERQGIGALPLRI